MADSERQVAEADRLYEKYGRPLEERHRSEYLAVSPTGQALIAPTLLEATKRATRALGPGNYLSKIGEEAVASGYGSRQRCPAEAAGADGLGPETPLEGGGWRMHGG